MKKNILICLLSLLYGCSTTKDANPRDPYENMNRRIYRFNNALDATMFKPVAKFYKVILPPQARSGIRNVFHNIQMVPTVANDVLQGELVGAYLDTWRLIINTTFGVGGLFDVAEKWGLPYKPNDLGITLGKWGDVNSPYFVMPIFGPSTFRDAAGLSYEYSVLSIYPSISSEQLRYDLFGLNMLQIRADFLDTEQLIDEALDEYALVRDAYLQNRKSKILEKTGHSTNGADPLYVDESGSGYVEDSSDNGSLYVDEEPNGKGASKSRLKVSKTKQTLNARKK